MKPGSSVMLAVVLYCASAFGRVPDRFIIGGYDYGNPDMYTDNCTHYVKAVHGGDWDSYYRHFRDSYGLNAIYFVNLLIPDFRGHIPGAEEFYAPNQNVGNFSLEFLDAAERQNMSVMLMDPNTCRISEQMDEAFRDPDFPYSSVAMQNSIDRFGSHPAFMGWYVYDEPGINQFGIIDEYSDQIEAATSGEKLAFTNMIPDYVPAETNNQYVCQWDYIWSLRESGTGTCSHCPTSGPGAGCSDVTYEEYIDHFIDVADPDILCYDFYTFQNNPNSFYRNLDVIARRCRDRSRLRTFHIVISQNRAMWFPGDGPLSSGELNYQAYGALAYGVKGLLYYGLNIASNDDDEWEHLSPAAKSSIWKLHYDLQTHEDVLLSLRFLNAYHVSNVNKANTVLTDDIPAGSEWSDLHSDPSVTGAQLVDDVMAGGTGVEDIMLSFLADDDGGNYFWTVNKDPYNAKDFFIRFRKDVILTDVFTGERMVNTGQLHVSLDGGAGRLHKMSSSVLHAAFAPDMPVNDDASIYDNDATVHGGLMAGPGAQGPCGEFDGVDDYLSFAHSGTYDVFNDELTIAAWIRPEPNGGSNYIACKGNNIRLYTYDNQHLRFLVKNDAGNYRYAKTTGYAFTYGEWAHVAATFDKDADNGRLRIYINGEEASYEVQNDTDGRPLLGSGSAFDIGGKSGAYLWKGGIDDVRVIDEVLSADDISSLYTVGEYRMNENSGAVIYDGSGNRNHAMLSGNAVRRRGSCGTAVDFDAIDDGATAAGIPAYADLNNAFTVSAWIAPDNNTGYDYVMSKGSNFRFYLRDRSFLWILVRNAAGAYRFAYSTGHTFANGEWTHVAATFDRNRDNGLLRLYINGQEASYAVQQNSAGYGVMGSDDDIQFGCMGNAYRWSGGLDEIRLYDRSLSGAEMADLYAAQLDCEQGMPKVAGTTDDIVRPASGITVSCNPNPVLSSTEISVRLPLDALEGGAAVSVSIYDINGLPVKTLSQGYGSSGSFRWDGRDASGRPVPQGLYFVKSEAGGYAGTGTLMVK